LYSYQIQVKNVVSAFRGELKKAALPICIEHYKLDSKYYDKDQNLKLLENGGDPRVAAAAKAALKDSSYLAGPPDCNVWKFWSFSKYSNIWNSNRAIQETSLTQLWKNSSKLSFLLRTSLSGHC
jgi:hypothetical protein